MNSRSLELIDPHLSSLSKGLVVKWQLIYLSWRLYIRLGEDKCKETLTVKDISVPIAYELVPSFHVVFYSFGSCNHSIN